MLIFNINKILINSYVMYITTSTYTGEYHAL